MLKKIAVAALTAGITLASFAQAGGAPNTIPSTGEPAPAAQTADSPKPAKQMTKHHAKKHAKRAHKKAHHAAQ